MDSMGKYFFTEILFKTFIRYRWYDSFKDKYKNIYQIFYFTKMIDRYLCKGFSRINFSLIDKKKTLKSDGQPPLSM